MPSHISPDAKSIQHEIKNFPFFKIFQEEDLRYLSQIMEVKHYSEGDFVLKQGDQNQTLYFLSDGELDVLVDNERVTTLNLPGEVLGEMSLIDKSPAKASVLAVKLTRMLSIKDSYFLDFPEAKGQTLQALLNQVLLQVLVFRLNRTNERAKKFEKTNLELQNYQQEIKDLNKNLEKEISRRSQELTEKVKDITETLLSKTIQQMSQVLQNESPVVTWGELKSWSDHINEATALLKPVIDLADRKDQNEFRRIFFGSESKKQQNIARLALGGTGITLDAFSNEEEILPAIEKAETSGEGPQLLILDSSWTQLINKLQGRKQKIPFVIMIEGEPDDFLNVLKDFPLQPYFVSRKSKNRAQTIKSLTTTAVKILNKDLFGIEKYLSTGAQVFESFLTSSSERRQNIENMQNHLNTFGLRSSTLDQLGTVVEEMLMNAIYDAPVDENGTPLYNHLPRTELVELKKTDAISFKYATDGVYVGVSVADPFGSLTRDILQNYLEKNFHGHESYTEGKGGAGKGLYMIVTNADHIVFNVKSKMRTEVIALVQIERLNEENPQPSIDLFFQS